MSTYMTPTQITTNVIVPGVEVAVTVAYPNGESWGGVLRNSKAPRHGRYPASGGQLWCPACEAPVEECREADEIRRRPCDTAKDAAFVYLGIWGDA